MGKNLANCSRFTKFAKVFAHHRYIVCHSKNSPYIVVDDQDEEATISEQEQMEDDNENINEVQQLNKEGKWMCIT